MKRFSLYLLQIVLVVSMIAICLMLASCAAPPPPVVETRIQIERVTIPPAMLTCAAKPKLNAWQTEADVADYIVRLDEAYADCSNDVAAIAHIEAMPLPAGGSK